MRTFSVIALVLTIASFSVPAVVFAGSANGTVCYTPSDCTSGNCVFEDSVGIAKCQANINPGQGSNPSGSVTLINPLKAGTSIESFLNSILDFAIRIGSVIVILMIVFVGYKFVVAQGKPDKIEEAKKMLLWTIVGALVLIGAKVLSAGILATVQSLGG